MDILYEDGRILVCIKPAGVLSAGDEPGGMVDLLRKELGDEHACVRSVHRLDAQVSGLMVFARSQAAAGILSEQVREHVFEKEYLAVVHGRLKDASGQMEDLLWYNRSLRKSRVMDAPGKDVKRALLSYEVLGYAEHADASLVKIRLHTGRTHPAITRFSETGNTVVRETRMAARPLRSGRGDSRSCTRKMRRPSRFLRPRRLFSRGICLISPNNRNIVFFSQQNIAFWGPTLYNTACARLIPGASDFVSCRIR